MKNMYALALVEVNGFRKTALVQKGELYDLSRWLRKERGEGSYDTLALLKNWDLSLPLIDSFSKLKDRSAFRLTNTKVRFLPPVLYPDKILCIASNYSDHIVEMGLQDSSSSPYFFFKSPKNTLIGDGDNIILPKIFSKVDWEVELAVIIGKRGRMITAEKAMEHVACYTVLNDISARDKQYRADSVFQYDWMSSKCCDTFCPLGPVMVPRGFIPEEQRLNLRLSVNGKVMQNADTGLMIHKIPEQIAFISQILTLEPGDILATGTPAGVGAADQVFLNPGDQVVAEIEGIGQLINYCIAE